MDIFSSPMIIGSITGSIIGLLMLMAMKWEVRQVSCPKCGQLLGNSKRGAITGHQRLWGGWTCPRCTCDIDRHGNERQHAAGLADWNEWRGLRPDFQAWFSAKVTFREILFKPGLIFLYPQLLIVKPWLIAVFLPTLGLLFGIAAGAKQGADGAGGGILEGALLGGFVVFVALNASQVEPARLRRSGAHSHQHPEAIPSIGELLQRPSRRGFRENLRQKHEYEHPHPTVF